MTTSRLGAAVALILVAFTAACGDDGGTGPSFADSVSTADAQETAGSVASSATYLAENLNFGEPSIIAARAMYARLMAKPQVVAAQAQISHLRGFDGMSLDWRAAIRPAGLLASPTPGCTFSGHGLDDYPYGDAIDANGNGIPDDAAFDIVCTYTEEGAGDTLNTYIDEQHVAIKEITGSIHGMNFKAVLMQGWHDNHGNAEGIALKQIAMIDLRSGSASTDQSMSVEVKVSEAGEQFAAGVGEQWGADFDPETTITLGNPLPNGDLSLNGRSYRYTPDGDNVSFSITTPTKLAYNAACALADTNPPFTGGVLLGRLNNNSHQASFEVTFTSCGNYTIAVDGAFDEVAAAGSFRP